MIAKTHKSQHGLVLVLCDDDLIGKQFEEGNLQLDLTKEFYKGELLEEEKLDALIEEATTVNAVGEKTINILKQHKHIHQENIKTIAGIPHIHIFKL